MVRDDETVPITTEGNVILMNLKGKVALLVGSTLVAGGLLTTAAFAATGDGAATTETPAASAPVQKGFNLDQAVADGKLTQAEADVMKQVEDLRKAAMEKLQADTKAVVDQAVADGKITQKQADKMLSHKGPGKEGHPGMSPEEMKAKLEEEVKAGKMTQEQADKILSGKGRPEGFGRHGKPGPKGQESQQAQESEESQAAN